MQDPEPLTGAGDRPPESHDRLRALTEQCLHLLDELARARERAGAADQLEARCVALEAALATARRHLLASRVRKLQPGGTAPGELEVILWIDDQARDAEVRDWLAAVATRLGDADKATLVCAEDRLDLLGALPGRIGALAHEGLSPAQQWNLALGAASARYVLVLASGTTLERALVRADWAPFGDELVAYLQPHLTLGDAATLGLAEDGDLVVRRAAAAGALPRSIDLPAPEAFVIRRDAWVALGPYDEDLVSPLALTEHALRAHAAGSLVVGVDTLRCRREDAAGTVAATGAEDERTQRDRLIVLARHRPQAVARALAGTTAYWNLGPDELRAWLRAIWQRLPDGGRGGTFELLQEAMVGAAGAMVPRERYEEEIAQWREHAGEMQEARAALQLERAALERRIERFPQEVREHLRPLEQEIERLHQALAAAAAAEQKASIAHGRDQANARAAIAEREQQLALVRDALDGRLPLSGPVLADAIRHRQNVATELERRLQEREHWVAALLHELSASRLRVRRRKLAAHELEFLRQRPGARPGP